MEQQFAAIMQQLQQSNQQMQTLIGQQAQQTQRMREDTQQQLAAQREALNQALRGRANAGIVDVTKVGKPEILNGTKESISGRWRDWSFQFTTWFASQFPEGESMLEWAKESHATIDDTVLREEATRRRWEHADHVNRQLHVALVSLCRDEAMTIVRNGLKGQGLDAWRKLTKEYDPVTPQANLRLLKRILQPSQQSLPNLRSYMESWEHDLRRYEARTGEQLPDSVRRLTLQAICPSALQQHLEFHAIRLPTFSDIKVEIESYLDIKVSPSGAAPMEVDSLESKGKSKGKSTWGKGKGSPTPGVCRHCSRKITAVHTEWDCWFKPRNMSPEAVAKRASKAKGKGLQSSGKGSKDQGQKGKAKGKGKSRQKGVHSLENQEWPQEEPGTGDQAEGSRSAHVSSLFGLDAIDADEVGPNTSIEMKGPRNALTYRDPLKPMAEKEERRTEGEAKVVEQESRIQDQDIPDGSATARDASSSQTASRRMRISNLGLSNLHFVLEGKLAEAARDAKARGDNEAEEECNKQRSEVYKKRRIASQAGPISTGTDQRLELDIAAGDLIHMAKKKFNSRVRAQDHRIRMHTTLARQRQERDQAWHEKFGDRLGEDKDVLRDKEARSSFRNEFDHVEAKSRTWSKPQLSQEAKRKKRKKLEDKLKEKGEYRSRAERRQIAKTATSKRAPKPSTSITQSSISASSTPSSMQNEVRKEEVGMEIPPWRRKGSKTPWREGKDRCEPYELPDEAWIAPSRWYPAGAKPEEYPILSMSQVQDDEAEDWKSKGWRRCDLTIDSGSSVSCLPLNFCPKEIINHNPFESRTFKSASGHEVKQHGDAQMPCYFPNGIQSTINFKVLEVEKALGSVAQMTQSGNKLHFEKDSAWMEDAKGNRYRIYLKNGVYVMPMRVCFPSGQPKA